MNWHKWIVPILMSTGCINEYQIDITNGHVDSLAEHATDESIHPQNFIKSLHQVCNSTIHSVRSNQESFVYTDAPLEFSVQVENPQPGQWVEWRNEYEQIIGETPLLKDGSSNLRFHQGEKYPSTVYATLKDESGHCDKTTQQDITLCKQVIEGIQSSDGWTFIGDASPSKLNWVDLTLNAQASQGAVFNPDVHIPNGSASIRFTVQTGNGINNGADGLALTIIDVDDPSTLEDLIGSAPPGGGLGYGIGGPNGSWEGDAFTIEIDTWPNVEEYEDYDPTEQSHIAITRNADPSNHVVWSPVPEIEDYKPHDIQIDITEESLRIYFDGEEFAHQTMPDDFTGGYVFLSGSTGWATNHHRVSDLEIFHDCF